jgi:hypothetical protein
MKPTQWLLILGVQAALTLSSCGGQAVLPTEPVPVTVTLPPATLTPVPTATPSTTATAAQPQMPSPTMTAIPTATPRPIPATETPRLSCQSGAAEITSPRDGDVVSGRVEIRGSVWCDSGFRYANLVWEDCGVNPAGCFLAGPPAACNNTAVKCADGTAWATEIRSGVIGYVDTGSLPKVPMTWRLTVIGATGAPLRIVGRVRVTVR